MDNLFTLPFLAGLPLAVTLPLLGALLRLRDEWLATLGLTHLAAATGLAGVGLGLAAVWAAPLGALLGALGKYASRARSNDVYALMMLAGWSLTLLIAANTALGHALAHALVDGQLYFAGWRETLAGMAVALLVLMLLPWLAPRLIRARLLPSFERANRLPVWRWHLSFDMLVALAVAVATATLGLMATFALVFIPAWLAYTHAANWRASNLMCSSMGVLAYAAAYALALRLDQPFGPTFVLLTVLCAGVIMLLRHGRRRT